MANLKSLIEEKKAQHREPNFTVIVRIRGVEQYRANYETWRASEDDYHDLLAAAQAERDAGIDRRVEVVKLKSGVLAARWSSAKYASDAGLVR